MLNYPSNPLDMRTLALFAGALLTNALLATQAGAQQKRTITFDDFTAARAVSDAQISPDGKNVLYAVRTTNVQANTRSTQTFLVPASGGSPRAFPSTSVSATEARWSPDGTHVAYIANGQLWVA